MLKPPKGKETERKYNRIYLDEEIWIQLIEESGEKEVRGTKINLIHSHTPIKIVPQTLIISSHQDILFRFRNHREADTCFINTGINDQIDMDTTLECSKKRVQKIKKYLK